MGWQAKAWPGARENSAAKPGLDSIGRATILWVSAGKGDKPVDQCCVSFELSLKANHDWEVRDMRGLARGRRSAPVAGGCAGRSTAVSLAGPRTRCELPRYSAKLLFIWDPDPVTESRRRRLCEERIVVFQSRSARHAVRKAKAMGSAGQLRFKSGLRLQFAGILQCMELGLETGPGEVWWELKRRSNPDHWARKAIRPVSRLYIFTDDGPADKPAIKALQPTRRARTKAKTKRSLRAARG